MINFDHVKPHLLETDLFPSWRHLISNFVLQQHGWASCRCSLATSERHGLSVWMTTQPGSVWNKCWPELGQTLSTVKWTFVYHFGRGKCSDMASCMRGKGSQTLHRPRVTNMEPARSTQGAGGFSFSWVKRTSRGWMQLCNYGKCVSVMQDLYTQSRARFTKRFCRQWAHLVPILLKWISNGWSLGWGKGKIRWSLICLLCHEVGKCRK